MSLLSRRFSGQWLTMSAIGLVLCPVLAWSAGAPMHMSANAGKDVIAYALISDPKEAVAALEQTIAQYNGVYPFTQLDISFLSPTMDPNTIDTDLGLNSNSIDYDQLLVDSFFSVDGHKSYDEPEAGSGATLKEIIATLAEADIPVPVYFSVGGWAYSNGNTGNDDLSETTTTFPLTTDIQAELKKYDSKIGGIDLSADNHDDNYVGQHNSLDNQDTKTLTDTWVKVAKAFGASGIDLDYEEQWLPAQANNQSYSDTVPDHEWSLRNNIATIKYAAYIQSLENSASDDCSDNFNISIAAPSIGAFNVNAVVGDDVYAGNFFYIGDGAQTAPLKGVIYNMANPDDAGLNSVQEIFTDSNGVKILDDLSSLGVMSYDLDDGYDNNNQVRSYWCVGWEGDATSGYPIARDPEDTDGYADVSCSIYDQTLAIAKAYQQLGVTSALDMGLEAYYPNYPISPLNPWVDPFVPFAIPLLSDPGNDLDKNVPFSLSDSKTDNQYTPDKDSYVHYWMVPKNLASDLNDMDIGMIFWSINNNEQSAFEQDKLAATNNAPDHFGVYASSMDYMDTLLNKYAADWSDVLSDLYSAYYP